MDDAHSRELIKAISELSRAIDDSTQERRDECCEAAIFSMLLDRIDTIAKRIKRLARMARALDSSTNPS